jgi:hypothetical protein
MGATPGSLRTLDRLMGLEGDELRGARSGARGTAMGDRSILKIPMMRWQQAVDVVFRIEPAARSAAKRTK